MKVLIWFLCFLGYGLLTTAIGSIGMIPTVLLGAGTIWLARLLCKAWDDHKAEEAAAEAEEAEKIEAEFAAQHEQRRQYYWNTHREEREKLEAELEACEAEKVSLTQQLNDRPEHAALAAYEAKLDEMRKEYFALGVFEKKKAKAIEEEFTKMAAEKDALAEQFEPIQEGLKTRITALENRIAEINEEFSKNR